MRSLVLLYQLCAISLTFAFGCRSDVAQFPMPDNAREKIDEPVLIFSENWKVLGPFRIGTRGIRDQIRQCRALCLTEAIRGRVGC